MTERRMIKASKTKAEVREEISREIDDFLASGGEVKAIPNGVSGNESNANLFSRSTHFDPKKERTPVNEIVSELDARKKGKSQAPSANKKPARPKKKLITDDFGEPIRWVWDDGN